MSDTNGFQALHPSVQYAIATHLGWSSLRPVQELAVRNVMNGETTLILAPTAGGKTEAAIFPLLSRLLDDRWAPTSVLYLAPLRALLNDLGQRLGDLASQLGLSVGVWHGDVGQRERKRLVAAPPDLLLTTPESLEVLLSFAAGERRTLLTTLRAVVVDEIHAFYGADRGTQLLSLLERLRAWSGVEVQRVGLSATIGNPEDLLAWFRGSSTAQASIVAPIGVTQRVEVFDVSYRESLAGIVEEVRPYGAEKVLAFCRTRSAVEELAHALEASGLGGLAHHSALSRTIREDAESEFRGATRGFLAATSTLELGVDIGNIDRVVQVDAPTTVAALLQRLGRSGRRGAPAKMSLIATNPEQLVLGLALLSLRADGWIEPITPPWKPFPVLVQQILASVVAASGIARGMLVGRLSSNAAFARITPPEIERLIDHLLEIDVLEVVDGGLTLGALGERLFERRSFVELASVFLGSDSVSVLDGDREVGTLDRWFIEDMQARSRSTFLLNGRPWNVVRWPDDDAILSVVSAPTAEAPMFLGSGLVLGYEVMQRMRRVVSGSTEIGAMLPRGMAVANAASEMLARLQDISRPLGLERHSTPIVAQNGFMELHTYAGLRANRLIADAAFEAHGLPTVTSNTTVKVRTPTLDVDAVRARLQAIVSDDDFRVPMGRTEAVVRDTKFAELLDPTSAQEFSGERFYDKVGAYATMQRQLRWSTT